MISWEKGIYVLEREDKAVLINPFKESWVRLSKNALEDCRLQLIGCNESTLNSRHSKLYEILNKYQIVCTDDSKEDKIQINSIYFLTTLKCNMECNFCCVNASPDNLSKQMNLEDINQMICKIAGENVRKVILTGGEPFLRDELDDIVSLLKKKTSCRIQICTNGLLTEGDEKFYRHVDLIDISVENLFESNQNKNELEILKNKIIKFKSKNVSVCLSYVVTKCNKNAIHEFLDFAYINDVNISLKVVSPSGRAEQNISILLESEEAFIIMKDVYEYIFNQNYFTEYMNEFLFPAYVPQKQCAASGKILSIYPDGSVYSCFMLNKEPFLLGNIKSDHFNDIVDKIQKNKNTDIYQKCFDKDCKHICKDCTVRYFCEGNCFGVSNGKKNNILCRFYQLYFTFYMWEYSEHNSFESNLDRFLKVLESCDPIE